MMKGLKEKDYDAAFAAAGIAQRIWKETHSLARRGLQGMIERMDTFVGFKREVGGTTFYVTGNTTLIAKLAAHGMAKSLVARGEKVLCLEFGTYARACRTYLDAYYDQDSDIYRFGNTGTRHLIMSVDDLVYPDGTDDSNHPARAPYHYEGYRRLEALLLGGGTLILTGTVAPMKLESLRLARLPTDLRDTIMSRLEILQAREYQENV